MNSFIIGITRTGTPNDFVLNSETRYISLCGSNPEKTFSIECGQYKFFDIMNELRYADPDPDAAAGAISFFEDLATKFFTDLKYLVVNENDKSPLHIRLVMNPLELAQIPFEFALQPTGTNTNNKFPMLTNPERLITLTREVRQESESGYIWPSVPRILFAWAAPLHTEVPHEEHKAALLEIVEPLTRPKADKPYPEPDVDIFFTELPNASLQSISNAIANAIKEQRPYTHVNILAHGVKVEMAGREFRLLLCKEDDKDNAEKIDGKKLIQAFIQDKENAPVVISLSVCDSGNVGNTIAPTGSLVYQLHTAGIPCIFASQFPLTQQGSVKLIKTLYYELINACDPRVALYKTRIALKEDKSHDWASLVAYARFPQDINEQLQVTSLKMLFNSMKTTNAWVDHVFKFWAEIKVNEREPALRQLESRLTLSIDKLSSFLNKENNKSSMLITELLQAEHFGLLASAYKRKAEYLFRLIEFNPEKKADLINESADALEKAKEFYNCGLEANPVNHWTTMQYLSLKAVTEGSLKDENELWYIIKRMAERKEKISKNEKDKQWSWGTLTELYMLQPFTVPDSEFENVLKLSLSKAQAYLLQLKNAADADVIDSTSRQLERYLSWWPVMFPQTYRKELKESATVLIYLLLQPEISVS